VSKTIVFATSRPARPRIRATPDFCSETQFRFLYAGSSADSRVFDLRDTVFEESYPAQPRFGGWHCVSDFLSADSESFTDT
jgi:hypothetical protein